MMNKNNLFAAIMVLVLTAPVSAMAQAAAPATAACGVGAGNDQITKIMQNVSGAAMSLGAGLAVVGFVVAGILYLTSAGGEKMATAKKALIAAAIGSFLVGLAAAGNVMSDIVCKMFTT